MINWNRTLCRKFSYSINDYILELVSPNCIQLIYLLILAYDEWSQCTNETLSRLCIFFGLNPIIFDLLLSIFFAVIVCFILNFWREYCRSWKNFIKVLKLLSSSLFVIIGNGFSVYFVDIWETINYKSTKENCISNFITFYW